MGIFDSVTSTVGGWIDDGAHLAGSALDTVGLHDAAKAVDNWGDHVADDLGAAVGELTLGQSDDPKDLVHGDVKAIGDAVKHLQKFSAAFEQVAGGLGQLDSEHWQGKAADAFRAKLSPQPAAGGLAGHRRQLRGGGEGAGRPVACHRVGAGAGAAGDRRLQPGEEGIRGGP